MTYISSTIPMKFNTELIKNNEKNLMPFIFVCVCVLVVSTNKNMNTGIENKRLNEWK